MKYQIGAAAAALAIALVSGSLSAEPTSSKVLATSFGNATKVLSGLDSNFSFQELRHTAATTHLFAVLSYPPDPYLTSGTAYPPDPYLTCRTLAKTWNVAVYQNRSQATFDGILKSAATNNCSVQITRAAVPNADGSTDLVSITFATQ